MKNLVPLTRRFLAAVWLAPIIASAQEPALWRAFDAECGLAEPACASVNVSQHGNVLVTHPNTRAVTIFDGYTAKTVALPMAIRGRLEQSAGGQLWAATAGGVLEFRNQKWTAHTFDGDILGLHPLRHHHALALLPDRLIELDTELPGRLRTEMLIDAASLRLGRFTGLAAAHNGVWISAEHGMARASVAPRNLNRQSEWSEFPMPPELNAHHLREAVVHASGEIIAIAQSTADDETAVLSFLDGAWKLELRRNEPILRAWRSQPGSLWLATTGALLRLHMESGRVQHMPNFAPHKILDVAMEPGGSFWLATGSGLLRHAAPLWRTPASAALDAPVEAIASDDSGVWFATHLELHRLEGELRRSFRLADSASGERKLFRLAGGTLVLESGGRLFRFNAAREQFEEIPEAEPGLRLRSLGLLPDGTLCLQADGVQPDNSLFTCDGMGIRPWVHSPIDSAWCGRAVLVWTFSNGDVWLNAEQSLARLRENTWQWFPRSEKNIPAPVIAFAELPDGRIVGATQDKLWRFDGREWSQMRAGFPDINALATTRDGVLWVATTEGVHRVLHGTVIQNSVEDGLPAAHVRALHTDSRGRVWAGTARGLAMFHPEADPDAPRSSVAGLADARGRVREGEDVLLTFNAVDRWHFTAQERLLFSYRLDEREWSPFSEANRAAFHDLTPGRHYFQLRAMDRSGNIETNPVQLQMTVTVPWFKEARLIVIAFAGMTVALFFAALALNRHRRLRHSYAEVERQVADRTRELELAYRELLHSQKMNALGALSAGIAHDFNNILSIIKGSAQIIEDNLDNEPKVRTRLDRIKTVVQQGAGIVEAMLGFSRNSDAHAPPCDVNGVVNDTVKLLGEGFLREVDVRIDAAEDLPAIPLARDFVQQVLLNFIFNAAESMSGQRRITVTTRRLASLPAELVLLPARADCHIAITVTDCGCGIAPENLSRIFEPFFTTKAMSARRGTGLGLSMVYELAKKMEAGLAVQSTVGAGSSFTLLLPVREAAPSMNPDPAVARHPQSSSPISTCVEKT